MSECHERYEEEELDLPQQQILLFPGSLQLLQLHVILKSILADSENLHLCLRHMTKPEATLGRRALVPAITTCHMSPLSSSTSLASFTMETRLV